MPAMGTAENEEEMGHLLTDHIARNVMQAIRNIFVHATQTMHSFIRLPVPSFASLVLHRRAVPAQPPTSDARLPAIENGHFVTRDGLALGFAHWDAASPRVILVALHGMNDYSNAFEMPARLWARSGITTYAYDQRGFGHSPQIGLWPLAHVMSLDLVDFVEVVRARHPGLPVIVLGESMGGAVALSAFASFKPPQAQGCILVGPAVWGWSALPFLYRAALWLLAHTLPRWGLTGAGRHIHATDNDVVTRAYGRDPLFLKTTRADTVYGLVSLMGEGASAGAHLGILPVLLLYGGNDQIIPRAATLVFVKLLGPSAKVKFYPEGFHMLLRDRAGAACATDVVEWIEAITRQERAGAVVKNTVARGDRSLIQSNALSGLTDEVIRRY